MKIRIALTFAVVAAGCPPASLVGQPCADAGESTCEGDALLRCDGRYYVELAPCAFECRGSEPLITHAAGLLSADETWTCAEGPHLVSGTLTVAADATLSIEAGAQVRLDPASRINTDVAGRLDALGTLEAPILVTSNNNQSGGFGAGAEGGLNVFAVENGEPSRLEHTIVERGLHGIGVFGLASDATPPVVDNCTLRDNLNFGLLLTCSGDPELPDFAATNNFFNNGTDISECNPP
jgi:hypothetical protein